ncbi:hypothetical protein JCM13304A_24790 [Desulfothermus okinawensis JCM 13304]
MTFFKIVTLVAMSQVHDGVDLGEMAREARSRSGSEAECKSGASEAWTLSSTHVRANSGASGLVNRFIFEN